MIDLQTLTTSEYKCFLAKLLFNSEADSRTPYFDCVRPNAHVTIGRGFDIEPDDKVRNAVFAIFGLGDSREKFPEPTIDDVIAETRQTYSGPLVVGEDLMSFEIGDTVTVRYYKP